MKRTHLIRTILLIVIISPLSLCAQSRPSASLRGAYYIEPLIPSPTGHDVAGFAFPLQDGEHPSGTPFVASTSGRSVHVHGLKTEVLDSDGIVWSGRPHELYLASGEIYLWQLGQPLRKVWNGIANGLAISKDGRRLAFWNLQTSDNRFLELVVLDIATARAVRHWEVKLGWEKDMHGFDIWFGTDGKVVYALTFESDDGRPLRAFEIDTGKTTMVTTNCACMAETADGMYYLQAWRPDNSWDEHYDLYKFTNRTDGQLVKSNVPAAVCSSHRAAHLLAGITKKKLWIFDSRQNRFTSFPTKCDKVAVFSDSTLMFARKNRLLWKECK